MGEVKVGYGKSAQETAILLLAAAEETETDKYLVRHLDGAFYVPEEVAEAAGVDYESEDGENVPVRSEHHPDDIGQSVAQDAAEDQGDEDEVESPEDEVESPETPTPPPAKKAAAKRAPAKKAAAKKSGN